MSDPIDPGEEKHALVGLNVFLFVVFVVVCLVIGYVLRVRRLMWLPESGAHMLFGLVIGGFLTLLGPDEVEYITFDPELFFFVLLPPIIFEAGFTLKQREFFGNIGAILSFAVLGTLVSTLVIGLCIYVLALAHVVPLDRESPLESLLFGALISAVDPVATLAILGNEHVNADRTLRALVFGESVLNDAVSIVLFNSLKKFGEQRERAKGDDDYEAVSMGNAMDHHASWTVCFRDTYNSYEFAVFILCVFGTYSLAETLEFSGVISLFCCGIVMSHYALHSMSRIARNATKHIFKTFAMLAETFVFVYLGITAGISFAPSQHMVWSVMFILFTILLCFASRACHIFPFSMLLNLRRRKRITRPMQVAMWFSGLRGAVAFALALNVPAFMVGRGAIVTTTLSVVFFTTLVLGGLTERMLEKLQLKNTPVSLDGNADSDDSDVFFDSSNRFVQWWLRLDRDVLRPMFGGGDNSRNDDDDDIDEDDGNDTALPVSHRSSPVSARFSINTDDSDSEVALVDRRSSPRNIHDDHTEIDMSEISIPPAP